MTDELYIQPVTRIVGCATEAHKRILTLARAALPEETRDELTMIALLIQVIPPEANALGRFTAATMEDLQSAVEANWHVHQENDALKKMIAPDRDVTRAPIEDARLHGAA